MSAKLEIIRIIKLTKFNILEIDDSREESLKSRKQMLFDSFLDMVSARYEQA